MQIQKAEIEEGMEKQEFCVYYQPQYDSLTNRMTGAEALARWIRKDGTMVMPSDFIPVMEEEGLIVEHDWYMLDEVCRFLKSQRDYGLKMVPISVNFSRKHMEEEEFLLHLNAIVDFYEVSHESIVVEITENTFSSDARKALDFCNKIREDGYHVAIDDFGSGFSSLSFLKDLNADILKIDKSLLKGNFEDDKERIVLESIFNFASRLKLCTVAEGVETRQQLGFLRTCDCNIIQGYLFAEPMNTEAFKRLCVEAPLAEEAEDIITIQNTGSAIQFLLEAVFDKFPLVIFANLTRNSYYMMAYDNFMTKTCYSSGNFDELIAHGSTTMHPKDQQKFLETFDRQAQIEAYENGEKRIRLITRQLGDDNVYRKVETTNYFVKNPSSDDLLVITMCSTIE